MASLLEDGTRRRELLATLKRAGLWLGVFFSWFESGAWSLRTAAYASLGQPADAGLAGGISAVAFYAGVWFAYLVARRPEDRKLDRLKFTGLLLKIKGAVG